jgi:hypothetical protein
LPGELEEEVEEPNRLDVKEDNVEVEEALDRVG